jgi:hypothetical protein
MTASTRRPWRHRFSDRSLVLLPRLFELSGESFGLSIRQRDFVVPMQ